MFQETDEAKKTDNYQLALAAYKRAGRFCNDHIKELGHKGSVELVDALQLQSTVHVNAAIVHATMGHSQAAVSECKVAIKVYPGNMKVHLQLQHLHQHLLFGIGYWTLDIGHWTLDI